MIKYTLPELAQKFLPPEKQKLNVTAQTIGWLTDAKPESTSLNKAITVDGAHDYQLSISFKAAFDYGYNVNDLHTYITFDGVQSQPIDMSPMYGDNNDQTYAFTGVINFPKGQKHSANSITVSHTGYKWGDMNISNFQFELINLDGGPLLTTVSDCLTAIADYVRSHPNPWGGS